MALQAISFKLAKLVLGSDTLKAQIATNANIFVLMRNFVIASPPSSLPISMSVTAHHSRSREAAASVSLFGVKGGVARSAVGAAGIVAALGAQGWWGRTPAVRIMTASAGSVRDRTA